MSAQPPQARLTRAERFTNLQNLIAEIRAPGAEPARILTRLFNGLTTELTKCENEINALQAANAALVSSEEAARVAREAALLEVR
jgi:hypothetical protein